MLLYLSQQWLYTALERSKVFFDFKVFSVPSGGAVRLLYDLEYAIENFFKNFKDNLVIQFTPIFKGRNLT